MLFFLSFISFALHSSTVCCMNCGVRELVETETEPSPNLRLKKEKTE